MSTQPNSPSTMVMNVIGRVVQATYSILLRSNTTTGNDTSDSYILHPSPQSPESTKDNSQPRTLQNVSPDGPIFPKYHSTPNPVSDLNIMSGGSSILSIPSLSKFESDSSDESTNSKEVSPSGSTRDLRFDTPIETIDLSDSSTNYKNVSPLGSRSDLNLETAILPNLNSIPVPVSSLEEFSELDLSEEPSLPISSSLSNGMLV